MFRVLPFVLLFLLAFLVSVLRFTKLAQLRDREEEPMSDSSFRAQRSILAIAEQRQLTDTEEARRFWFAELRFFADTGK